MPNRLANEKSLYLRQHADNPVDWWPWCPEAFAHAEEAGKPIIVSVGYSACHWCHVMAHECFEDEFIADLMNKHFVCIKVDREERPDVDQIYMEAVQMINQRGGWPLNAFLLPDGRPFFGGTYFPAKDNGHGITPWPQLIMRIADYYKKSPQELEDNAENIVKNLVHSNTPAGADGSALSNEDLLTTAQTICQAHDDEWGGFGEAPKFPPSMTLDFLLAIRGTQACEQQPAFAERIDTVANTTLKCMAHGGLFDQIGGGFARYSVDKYWIIPHFEKMLYDNGQLIDIYTKGYLRYQKPLYKAVVDESIGWLLREMKNSTGGFAAALDADSEGVEGKYYVWRPEEIAEILGPDKAKAFCENYAISDKGNFEDSTTNPILVYNEIEKREAFAEERALLLKVREQRVPPAKDEKRILSWNCLVIRGLAEAGFYFNRTDWFEEAQRTADWIWERMRNDQNRLYAIHYENGPQFNAYLDDYANYIESLLCIAAKIDWIKPGMSALYIDQAAQMMDIVLEQFRDPQGIGFYFTSNDHEALVSRKKDWFDNALPAGNSSLIHGLSMLYAIKGEQRYADELLEQRKAYPGILKRAPNAVSHALSGYTADAMGIAVIKVKDVADLKPLQAALAQKPWRRTFILNTGDPKQPSGYQLCIGTQCQEPTVDVAQLMEWI